MRLRERRLIYLICRVDLDNKAPGGWEGRLCIDGSFFFFFLVIST